MGCGASKNRSNIVGEAPGDNVSTADSDAGYDSKSVASSKSYTIVSWARQSNGAVGTQAQVNSSTTSKNSN